jgi:hypothetical protein
MNDDLVAVYTSSGPAQAALMKSMLEAEGIPVMSVQEGAGAAYGLVFGPLGEVTLLVSAKHAEAARALIREVEPEDPEEADEEEADE